MAKKDKKSATAAKKPRGKKAAAPIAAPAAAAQAGPAPLTLDLAALVALAPLRADRAGDATLDLGQVFDLEAMTAEQRAQLERAVKLLEALGVFAAVSAQPFP